MIEWNQEMSVDIAGIDEQHRHLIDLVHQLYGAVKGETGDEQVREKFKEFLKVAAVHFSTEERIMNENGYPFAALHQREHRKIAVFADEFRDLFDEGMVQLSIDMLAFLGDWLKNHILNTDMRYHRYFSENGICVKAQ